MTSLELASIPVSSATSTENFIAQHVNGGIISNANPQGHLADAHFDIRQSTNTNIIGTQTIIHGNLNIHTSNPVNYVEEENNENVPIATETNGNASLPFTPLVPGHPKGTSRRRILIILALTIGPFIIGIFLILWLPKAKSPSPSPSTTPPSSPSTTTDPTIDEPIISRKMWGAIEPRNATAKAPSTLVVIKHTGDRMCNSFNTCSATVREIQRRDMEDFSLPDIRYNVLIGGDGKIYMGRGWNVQNEGRSDSFDIAFIGNFNVDFPTKAILDAKDITLFTAFKSSVNAVQFSKYNIVNHNQTERTDSPGENMYKKVITWRRYTKRTFFSDDD